MGSKGGSAKQPVTDYYIAAHYGVCHEADEILEIRYGEKRIVDTPIAANGSTGVSKPNLFGGPKREGGFVGVIDVMFGGAAQLVSDALAASLQRNGASDTADPDQLPGYRGVLSFFIHGGSSGRAGANIGSNTAMVKSLWAKVRRACKGLPSGLDPVIVVDGMQLANPAAIIYECLTNREWGMGRPASLFDDQSFIDAAATLAGEGFGLALLWHRQQSIEEFVGEIQDTIEGALGRDPFTGRIRLKLVRDDYDPEQLPVFGPHNSTLRAFDRKGWGDTINEINVVWTNPANEQTETVTVHDTANVNLQGGEIVSDTVEYIGIRTAELALRCATRDLLVGSSALATAELETNREGWRLLPGDVIALTWPDYGFESIPMRITDVDYGKPGDSKITLSLIEDVFGMPAQSYVESDGSAWVNPARDPEPLTWEHITSVPYFALAQQIGDAAAEAVDDTSDFDLVFGAHDLGGVFDYELMHQVPDANGDTVWTGAGTVDLAGRGLLQADIPRETITILGGLDSLAGGENFVQGTLVWIGPIDPTGELGLIKAVDTAGHHIARGVLDTVPQEWPAGTPVWALHGDVLGSTGVERALSETATVRLLTNTANGQLDVSAAADVTTTMSGRLHLPYRPANVQVNGELWPDQEIPPDYPALVTWAGRNRLDETAVLNSWSDGHVTPEAGVTFEVVLYGEDGNGVLTEYLRQDLGTDTSYSVDIATDEPPSGSTYVVVEIRSLRDGLACWQSATQRLRLFSPVQMIDAYFQADEV
ncbi:phage tail protein [Halomonas stenophila]|uniref:Tip attachment protein J domain-containing protein n=1 Tax=Halomonas stenophila TaxID=795312 RepID=A0A7W5EWN0_9GAMM|nr:phage tail protein [Halomonas stenophila]MBB3231695.1 hypothetical protein [Halomonas stenophila]